MRRTAGFTLLEMLVATGIFLIGFSAAYGLFALGMYYRQQSESLTKASLAANALLDEFRLESGLEGTVAPFNKESAPCKPNLYVGNGFAGDGREPDDPTQPPSQLYAYKPMPGVFYVVTRCTDLKGGDDQLTTTLHLTLVVAPLAIDDKAVTIADLRRRFRMTQANGSNTAMSDDQIIDELVKRGLAFRFHSALLRRASWLPRA